MGFLYCPCRNPSWPAWTAFVRTLNGSWVRTALLRTLEGSWVRTALVSLWAFCTDLVRTSRGLLRSAHVTVVNNFSKVLCLAVMVIACCTAGGMRSHSNAVRELTQQHPSGVGSIQQRLVADHIYGRAEPLGWEFQIVPPGDHLS